MALNCKSFPQFTKLRLGLPADSNLENFIDEKIADAGIYASLTLGAAAFATISATANYEWALEKLVEADLWDVVAGALADKIGTRRQGGATVTRDAGSYKSAQTAAAEARAAWEDRLALLGGAPTGTYSIRTQRA
jgi:hypothetical protein